MAPNLNIGALIMLTGGGHLYYMYQNILEINLKNSTRYYPGLYINVSTSCELRLLGDPKPLTLNNKPQNVKP